MIKFERGLNHSYLIFEDDEEQIDELSVSMLRENHIEGLLPVKISKRNGRIETVYEISMFQNMVKAFEKKRIRNTQILLLLRKLNSLLEELEAYFLCGQGLCIEPEYIHWTDDLTDVFFCYDPNKNHEKQGMALLSELILKRADFGDYKSVVFAYELHQAVGTENFSLSGIIEKFEDFDRDSSYSIGETKPDIVAEPDIARSDIDDMVFTNTRQQNPFSTSMVNASEGENINKDIVDFFDEEDDWEKEITTGRLFGKSKRKKTKKQKDTKKTENNVDEFAEESFFMVGEKDDNSEKNIFTSRTITLKSLNGFIDDFIINSYPYLIGNIKYAVDTCIESEEISRFHARFDQNRGKLYLSDLNSATGTYLNGERLKGSAQKEIKIGDKIRFGSLDFVVEYDS